MGEDTKKPLRDMLADTNSYIRELEARITEAIQFVSQPNELEGFEKVDLIRLMTECARILRGERT